MATSKRKPCPFCPMGTLALVVDTHDGATQSHAIVCSVHKNGCGGSSGYQKSRAAAVRAWNKRSK